MKKLHNFVAVNSLNTKTNAMKLLFLVITFCAQAFGVVKKFFPPRTKTNSLFAR